MLSTVKINALAELMRDVGSIFFASVFIGPLLEKQNIFSSVLGLALAATSWYFGIKLIKE